MRDRKRWKLGMAVMGIAAAMVLSGCGASEQPKKENEVQTEAKATDIEVQTEAKAEDTGSETEVPAAESADTETDVKVADKETETEAKVAAGLFSGMKTVDLEGNEVDSGIFAENRLTLVNLWSTGCTPCIMEIPELDKLNQDLAEQGVAVKGLLYDFAPGLREETRKEAEAILEKAGATYQQLTVSEDMFATKEIQMLMAFPTTYFVDENGTIIDRMEGSRDYESWKAEIDKKLEAMTGAQS